MFIIRTKFYQIKVTTRMKSYDQSIEINHSPDQSYILDIPHKILLIGGSGTSKTNVLLNLIKFQCPEIDQIYFHVT